MTKAIIKLIIIVNKNYYSVIENQLLKGPFYMFSLKHKAKLVNLSYTINVKVIHNILLTYEFIHFLSAKYFEKIFCIHLSFLQS